MVKYVKGFTLAEVLITLVIIGVIAAITVPALMNNTQGQEYKSGLKKAISSLNQALTLHYALEGVNAADYDGNKVIVVSLFKKRMDTIDAIDGSGPYATPTQFTISVQSSGTTYDDPYVFTTTDGMKYVVRGFYTALDTCDYDNDLPCTTNLSSGNIWIDVNGDRGPNQMTTSANSPKDIYQAMIYPQKVVPWGDAAQQIMFDKQVTTN